jgi:predicted dehydrogenase
MNTVLNSALIGAGNIARGHLNAISKLDTIRAYAIMDVDEERVKKVADEIGAKPYSDLESLLSDDQIDAIHVCSPHFLHADQAVAAAKAGKHVLVEKPMALTVPDCDRMIEACEQAGKVLMVGQVMRKFPAHLKIRELIEEGAIGSVGHMMRRRYGYFDTTGPESSYGGWYMNVERAGNCVLYGFGSHEFDILQWFLNSPAVKVYAQGTESTELYRGQKDSYSTVMNHANGAVSVLSQSVVCKPGSADQFFIGSEGSMQLAGGKLTLNDEPVEIPEGDGMKSQIQEFASCCLGDKIPDANGKSVRHTMAVIEAAKQSAERDEPVLVSEFD